MQIEILQPENTGKRLEISDVVNFLNKHFTTQEEMEARLSVLCMDFAQQIGFNFRENVDTVFFVHPTMNADNICKNLT